MGGEITMTPKLKLSSRSAISNPKRLRRTSERRGPANGLHYPATMEVLAMKAGTLLRSVKAKYA